MINWKVRFKNPLFWVHLIAAVSIPMFAGVGMEWESMTSWPVLGDTVIRAFSNPVVLVAMAVAAWGVVNDPTVYGAGDSLEVMDREEPKRINVVRGEHAKTDEEGL